MACLIASKSIRIWTERQIIASFTQQLKYPEHCALGYFLLYTLYLEVLTASDETYYIVVKYEGNGVLSLKLSQII